MTRYPSCTVLLLVCIWTASGSSASFSSESETVGWADENVTLTSPSLGIASYREITFLRLVNASGDIVGFAYTSIQRGVISDTNLDSDDGDDDGDGDEAVPVPSIVGCCYLPVVSFNGLACYVASYNYTIDVESFSSTQASFWINLDVSGAAMFTPISFLSVTETVSKGLPRIWDLGDMEWSISTGTSLLRGGVLETMYFQGKVSNESFKVLLSASVATNIGKLSLLDAYITPLDLELLFHITNFTYQRTDKFDSYLTLQVDIGGPQLLNSTVKTTITQNTNALEFSGYDGESSYAGACRTCNLGYSNGFSTLRWVVVSSSMRDRNPELQGQLQMLYGNETNTSSAYLSYKGQFTDVSFDLVIGLETVPSVLPESSSVRIVSLVFAILGGLMASAFMITLTLCAYLRNGNHVTYIEYQ